jgi:transcriptional regulator with XRE-family HTH domain
MQQTPTFSATPMPVKRALRKLGQDMRDARLRRRIPTRILAERASISRTTLYKAERGDENVSVGTYATILFVLGMIEQVSNLADPGQDKLGRQLDDDRLPKRIRLPRPKPASSEG